VSNERLARLSPPHCRLPAGKSTRNTGARPRAQEIRGRAVLYPIAPRCYLSAIGAPARWHHGQRSQITDGEDALRRVVEQRPIPGGVRGRRSRRGSSGLPASRRSTSIILFFPPSRVVFGFRTSSQLFRWTMVLLTSLRAASDWKFAIRCPPVALQSRKRVGDRLRRSGPAVCT